MPDKKTCYIEKLYHFRCDCDTWWTMADARLKIGQSIYCPRCGTRQVIKDFEIGEDKLTSD